jgi:hypothetical protein
MSHSDRKRPDDGDIQDPTMGFSVGCMCPTGTDMLVLALVYRFVPLAQTPTRYQAIAVFNGDYP